MKKISVLLAFAALFFIALPAKSDHLRDQLLVTARMNGVQEVPSVNSTGIGVAVLKLNPTRDSMCITISMAGLDTITGIHIHEGVPGTNGPVILDLTPYLSGHQVTANITGSALTQGFITNLIAGNYYVNAHTPAHTGGEIRGQLYLENDIVFTADLSAANEIPPAPSDAIGIGIFHLSQDEKTLRYEIYVRDYTDTVIAIHLHLGGPTNNGPVAVTLNATSVGGNFAAGTVDSLTIVDDLKAGNVYVNVHTATFTDGELRGQLVHDSTIVFDLNITGDQEVPEVSTIARGFGFIKLSPQFNSISYDIIYGGFPTVLDSVKFFSGGAGFTGPALFNISQSVNGPRIQGSIGDTGVTTTFVNQLLRGEVYVNFLTSGYPDGEIRGQAESFLRKGYSIFMTGDQQVPSVATSGYGSGFVSIDRTNADANVMAVFGDLSGSVSSAHFHGNVFGENGDVIFDLGSFINANEISGRWTSNDTVTAFDTAFANTIDADSVYLNIHTAQNPNGEIRGQVVRNSQCNLIATGIFHQVVSRGVLNAYPNPATDNVTLTFFSNSNDLVELTIRDVAGREVLRENISVTSGTNDYLIHINNLSSGVYNVQLNLNDKLLSAPFVK